MDVKTGNLVGSTSAMQSIVLPDDEIANESVYQYQASNISGAKKVGYLSIYREVGHKDQVRQIKFLNLSFTMYYLLLIHRWK